MHVSVLGVGALGRGFGVRLAKRAGVDVEFVVRPSHTEQTPLRIEGVESGENDVLDTPVRVLAISPHADVVLVCVPSEQLGEVATTYLTKTSAPIVVACPMLPRAYRRLRAQLGDRLVAGMSSVTGYVNDEGVTRYWVSRSAKTLVDESPGRSNEASVAALVTALGAAGIDSRFELGVHETNPATTIAFLPLILALDVAGSSEALLGDAKLVQAMLRACDETRVIAAHVGKVAFWAGLLMRFVGPTMLKIGINLARKRAPEAVRFVEFHFGRKVRAQNVAMAEETIAIATEKGAPHAALDALLSRLVAH